MKKRSNIYTTLFYSIETNPKPKELGREKLVSCGGKQRAVGKGIEAQDLEEKEEGRRCNGKVEKRWLV